MITAYSQVRRESITTVTVTSDLSGDVYFHWYLDGSFVGTTRTPSRAFMIPADTHGRVDCTDTDDPDLDPPAKLDDDYSPRRTLWWIRSLSTDVECYRVEQQEDGGDWSEVGTVASDGQTWSYELTTPPLTDLASIAWRIVPVDEYGNDGTPLTIPAETIVRWPDAPEFSAEFDAETSTVTFAEVS